jgi:AraC family transcriptional regulator
MVSENPCAQECSDCLYACPDVNFTRSRGKATLGPAVADYPRGARMPPRVIDDFELVWMLDGQALFTTEDAEIPLSPGVLLLVPPGVRHAFVWDQRRASRHGYVHFRPDRLGDRDEASARSRRMTDRDPLAGLCAYLIWLGGEQPEGWERHGERTLAFLLELFMSELVPGDETEVALPGPIAAAVGHLRHEWSQMPLRRVSVDELAVAARISRSYLSRLFHAEFDIGVGSALEGLRCSRAETLLTRTDMPIGSVARACGFADLYHFSHRFARRHGVSPSAFRGVGAQTGSSLDHPGVRRLARLLWE